MSQIYCGNNRLDVRLVNGTLVLGNRYSCLRKGVGVGLHLPRDPAMNDPYEPIDDTKVYCGNSDNLPDGYDRNGTNSECFRKGVGTGKKIRASR